MKRLLFFAICLAAAGCCHSDPVTSRHWDECVATCGDQLEAVKEACVSNWRGRGCSCTDGSTIWLDE